jgi:hypothetical protein
MFLTEIKNETKGKSRPANKDRFFKPNIMGNLF